ncbi:MAG: methyltransferase type 11 [Frankiales bacterium]|nr:methyltransferase type 11 [Frankiales bacterium]
MTTYTHGHAEPVLRSHRWRTVENSAAHLLPHLRPDQTLLDVGCGPATITADLADRVGRVVGLEHTQQACDVARAELAARGHADVEVLLGDVHALDLPDDSFDVVHAHQVLQHVADPVQALREMARVCKPGGVVAVRDSDYLGFAWYPECRGLTRWMELYQAAALANGGQPQAGRRLLAWAHEAGLTDVTATSRTWCFATPQDRQWWGGMWADRIQRSALTTQLLASGLATQDDLDLVTAGWQRFADDDDAWMSLLHGELLVRVP